MKLEIKVSEIVDIFKEIHDLLCRRGRTGHRDLRSSP